MTTLIRGLGPWMSASIVVGTIIGTGVFFKTATMTQLGGSAAWVLIAWAVGGALSLAGAMTYAELGSMYPAAGGEYVYLRHGYGPGVAYLYAWNRFWIVTPASIAAYAVGSATLIGEVLPAGVRGALDDRVVAIAFIVVFTAVNCMNVRAGGRLHTALTVLKVAMIVGLAGGALFAPVGSWDRLTGGAFPGWSAFAAMVVAALWAYDGWNNLPMAAGEVRDPARTLPRALIGGTICVFAIYALVNLGFFHALPLDQIATANSDAFPKAPAVASRAAATFLGDTAGSLLAVAMTVSALSAMNGSMLTGARVPYAVARDGLAPAPLARLSEGSHIPLIAVLVQGAIACVYALTGRFDQLTNAVVFASWMFYALNAGSVLLLRRRAPELERPYRVPGFPVVPLVFVVLALLLLAATLYVSPGPSALGLGATALGGIVYAVRYRACRPRR